MFALNAYPGRLAGLEDATDDTPAAGTDPYLNAIRAISVPMGQLRQRLNAELAAVSNADAVVDVDQVLADVQQMNAYAQQLPGAIAAFRASSAYKDDAATAAELSNWLAFAADWAGSTLAAVPGVLLNAPTTVANYISQQLQGIADALTNALNRASGDALKAVEPLLIGGAVLLGGVLLFTRQAERTRTYRKYVA
jgi:hypothetical protein